MSQFKLVPVEPTKEMIDAASSRSLFEEDFGWAKGYAVMVAAAPEPAQEPVGEVAKMPGTDGFTMACFKAEDVPIGTKLYAAPAPPTNLSDARDAAIRRMSKALDDIYEHNEACRAAVLMYYGALHDGIVTEVNAIAALSAQGWKK